MHCYKWYCLGLCLLQMLMQEGRWFQDTSLLLLGVDQGTACSLAVGGVRTPRLCLAPRKIESCWWDVCLYWLFIALLRASHSSFGVYLHLLYVTWHLFIPVEVASPGNLCHSINTGNCPAVQLTSQFEKQNVFWLHLKGILRWLHAWGHDCNIFVGRLPEGVSGTSYYIGSSTFKQTPVCYSFLPPCSSSPMTTTNHAFLLECTHHHLLFLKGRIFVYMLKNKQASKNHQIIIFWKRCHIPYNK